MRPEALPLPFVKPSTVDQGPVGPQPAVRRASSDSFTSAFAAASPSAVLGTGFANRSASTRSRHFGDTNKPGLADKPSHRRSVAAATGSIPADCISAGRGIAPLGNVPHGECLHRSGEKKAPQNPGTAQLEGLAAQSAVSAMRAR